MQLFFFRCEAREGKESFCSVGYNIILLWLVEVICSY